MNDRAHQHQARVMDMIFGSLARPARSVVTNPDDHPKPPDLIAEVEQCATELEEAARIIEHGFPQAGMLFATAARRARAKAERARESGHAA